VPRLVNHRGKSTKAHVNAVGKDKNDEGSDTAHKSTLMNEELIGNTQSTEAEITEKLKELRVFPKLEHRWRHLNQVRRFCIFLIFSLFQQMCAYIGYELLPASFKC
jgi:uncharacterized protein with WD repeat